MLNGIGFVMIARLAGGGRDYAQQARVQSMWVTIGIAVFVVTLFVVRDVRVFARYRYIALLLGIVFMLLPLAPHIGQSRNGARLWVGLGPLSFEPNEIAKVLLVAFFAAYLADKREVLSEGRIRIGRWFLPSLHDLGPLLLAWGMVSRDLAPFSERLDLVSAGLGQFWASFCPPSHLSVLRSLRRGTSPSPTRPQCGHADYWTVRYSEYKL